MPNYQNGPFTVNEQIITDDNGTQWVELTLILSARVRVPLTDPMQQRAITLKAERLCLTSMLDDVTKGLEGDDTE